MVRVVFSQISSSSECVEDRSRLLPLSGFCTFILILSFFCSVPSDMETDDKISIENFESVSSDVYPYQIVKEPTGYAFIQNPECMGDSPFKYFYTTSSMEVYFCDSKVILVKEGPSGRSKAMDTTYGDRIHRSAPFGNSHSFMYDRQYQSQIIELTFKGSRTTEPVGMNRLHHDVNVFNGRHEEGTNPELLSFETIRYQGLYDGIDLYYHVTDGGLKSEFIVSPQADPGQIRVEVDGQRAIASSIGSELRIRTACGDIVEKGLVVYYVDDASERIPASFEIIEDDVYSYKLGAYDDTRTIVIDPIIYSTYLGGDDIDTGQRITVDVEGNTYIVGSTRSTDFPVQVPVGTSNYQGRGDIIVSKISDDGSTLIFSTFIGGSRSDEGLAIETDADGYIYVTGVTNSDDFPTTEGAYCTTKIEGVNNHDAFVCKLDPSSGSVVYCTLLGGQSIDTGIDLEVDQEGNVIVVGRTFSPDFPVTDDAVQDTRVRFYDGFLSIFDRNCTNLLYSTFLGGLENDSIDKIKLDSDGKAYIIGYTGSPDFPITEDATQLYLRGPLDLIFCVFDIETHSLIHSTFIGGSSDEYPSDITFTGNGTVLCLGNTGSTDFPVTDDALQATKNRFHDVVMVAISIDGYQMEYSTYIGGGDEDWGYSIDVDGFDGIFIAGTTGSVDFPVTDDAYQPVHSESQNDAFLMKVDLKGNRIVYSTFMGGSDNDYCNDMCVDLDGNPYLFGVTSSPDFPVSADPVQDKLGGEPFDLFVMKMNLSLELKPPVARVGPDRTVDQHQRVVFDGSNSSDDGQIIDWKWNFDYEGSEISLDGKNPDFVFDHAGIYQITLTVVDDDEYRDSDTLILTVRDTTSPTAWAGEDVTIDQYEEVILDGSGSTDNVRVVEHLWTVEFNGNSTQIYGEKEPFQPAFAGTYNVTLKVSDLAGNKAEDHMTMTVRDVTSPIADAGQDSVIMEGESVDFDGSGSSDNVGIVHWTWNFTYKQGSITLNNAVDTFTFDEPGTYRVTLFVEDGAGNNETDFIMVTVKPSEEQVTIDQTYLILLIVVISIIVLSALIIRRRVSQ